MKTDAYKAWTVGRGFGRDWRAAWAAEGPAAASSTAASTDPSHSCHDSWAVQNDISQGTLGIPGTLVWRGGEGRSILLSRVIPHYFVYKVKPGLFSGSDRLIQVENYR